MVNRGEEKVRVHMGYSWVQFSTLNYTSELIQAKFWGELRTRATFDRCVDGISNNDLAVSVVAVTGNVKCNQRFPQ